MVGVARGALFKRIEEEKGFGGWDPTPRRGIQTVGITESTRERARNNLDRHPNYILAAYMASGT